jgi:hypothetical protein
MSQPINQTIFALVLHAWNTFDALTPWFIALTFFAALSSLALIPIALVQNAKGKLSDNGVIVAMLFGTLSFTISGGAFLWFIGV